MINVIDKITDQALSTCFEKSVGSFIEKHKINKFKTDLIQSVREYINEHDGSVLTTGGFEKFLETDKLIENIIQYVFEFEPNVTKSEFIASKIERFHDYQRNNVGNSIVEDKQIKEFIYFVYQQVNDFYDEQLTNNESYISSEKKRCIKEEHEKTRRYISECIESKKNNEPMNSDESWHIYSSLSNMILRGITDEAINLYSIVESKNEDLKYSISFLLNLFLETWENNTVLTSLNEFVKNEKIYSDVCMIYIYYLLRNNEISKLRDCVFRNEHLNTIAKDVLNEKTENIFTVDVSEKDGRQFYNVKYNELYKDEIWLINRMCIHYIFSKKVFIETENIKQILGEPLNVIDTLMIFNVDVYKCLAVDIIDFNRVNYLYDQGIELENIIKLFNQDVRSSLYESLLKLTLFIDDDSKYNLIERASELLGSNKELELFYVDLKEKNNEISLDQVAEICMMHNTYWPLYSALSRRVNDGPINVKEKIEEYLFVIKKDFMIFSLYVQLVDNIDGREAAIHLLNQYYEFYKGILEYWCFKLDYAYVEEDLENVISLHKDKKLSRMIHDCELSFLNILMHHKKFEDVVYFIERNEISNLNDDIKKIKGRALVHLRRDLDALSIFIELYKSGDYSDEVIYNCLALALNNKRNLEEKLLCCAQRSDNSEVLFVLVKYYMFHNRLDGAFKYSIKAMLRDKNNNIEIYNDFIAVNTKIGFKENCKLDLVDVNTVVSLENSDHKICYYVIHPDNYLPAEYFEWGNAIHIYEDTAIELGIIMKKVGDSVEIEGLRYQVVNIETLKSYFCKISFNKLKESGIARTISIPTEIQSEDDLNEVKDQLLSLLGETNLHSKWFDIYRDLTAFPPPIYVVIGNLDVTYYQFVFELCDNKEIFFRNDNNAIVKGNGDYVLSYAALAVLYKLGWKLNDEKSDRYIVPGSLKRVLLEETEQVKIYNKREDISKLNEINGKLVIINKRDELKRDDMKKAIMFKRYFEKFKEIDNDKDIKIDPEFNIDIKEYLGIVDHDAAAIASNQNKTLVCAETLLLEVGMICQLKLNTVGITDFLTNESDSIEELLNYILRMIQYRFTNPFTVKTVERMIEFYENSNDEDKISSEKKWEDILDLAKENKTYNQHIINVADIIISQLDTEIKDHKIVKYLSNLQCTERNVLNSRCNYD